MKPSAHCIPIIRERFHRYLPETVRERIKLQASNGDYRRRIDPFALIQVFLCAYLSLTSGLRDIVGKWGDLLGSTSLGSLSYALGRAFNLKCVLALLDQLASSPLRRGDIIVLDSMPVSMPKSRRHNCKKMNNKTVGGGVLWQMCLTAERGVSPVRILKLIEGAWNDSMQIRAVQLVPHGPRYIMDRGFYAIINLVRWLEEGVHFVLRARKSELVYEEVRKLGKPRQLVARPCSRRKRTVNVLFDGIARIGSPNRRGPRPIVRLVYCEIVKADGKKEDLILMSDDLRIDAQRLLDLYGRRWEIEGFHRLLKRTIGLAHLYSFRQRGLEFLTAVALLLAVLLWLQDTGHTPLAQRLRQDIVTLLRKALESARRPLGMRHIWRPNMVGKQRWRHRA